MKHVNGDPRLIKNAAERLELSPVVYNYLSVPRMVEVAIPVRWITAPRKCSPATAASITTFWDPSRANPLSP